MFDQMLSRRAEFKVVEKAAEKGDYVRCSYEGTIEGVIAIGTRCTDVWKASKTTRKRVRRRSGRACGD